MVRSLSDLLAQKAREDADDRDLFSRSDARRQRKNVEAEWAELALTLIELTPRQLGRLELPEAVLDAVVGARRIASPVARDRALRRVRRELRDGAGEAIRAELGRLFEPGRTHPARNVWPERLLGGGEEALTEFCERHPGADRQELRRLVRNARRAKTEGQRDQALKALDSALRAAEPGEEPVD
jgi:ribosome-associated protein